MLKQFTIVTGLSAALLMGGAFQTSVEAAAVNQAQSQPYTIHNFVNGNYQQLSFHNQQQANEKEKQEADKLIPTQQAKNEQQSEKQTEEKTTTPEQKQEGKQEDQKQTASDEQELSAFEQEVVELTNEEREKQGLEPLKADAELSKVAREKSLDMSKNNYFSHNSPNYGSPFAMMQSFGIDYRAAGENIARGQQTPEEVVNGWMNSDGHRANILNDKFTHIGVGYVEEGNHWTQQFIGK